MTNLYTHCADQTTHMTQITHRFIPCPHCSSHRISGTTTTLLLLTGNRDLKLHIELCTYHILMRVIIQYQNITVHTLHCTHTCVMCMGNERVISLEHDKYHYQYQAGQGGQGGPRWVKRVQWYSLDPPIQLLVRQRAWNHVRAGMLSEPELCVTSQSTSTSVSLVDKSQTKSRHRN